MAIIETVNLDLKRPSQFVIIRVQQNDYLGNKIKVNITLDGEEYSIPTGTRAQLSMMAGNIVPVLHDCEVIGNQVIFTVTNDMTSYSGRFQAQIRLMNAVSGSLIKTLKFHLLVEEEIGLSEMIVQTSEFNTLDNALIRVEDVVENVGNSIRIVENINNQEIQREESESSRNSNEDTRIENENERILKESLRWNFRALTQAEYDALPLSEKLDPNIVYEILGSSEDFPQELATLISRTENAALAAEELVVNKAGINDLIATRSEAFSGYKVDAKFSIIDNEVEMVKSQMEQKASWVIPEMFGAIGNGVADDSSAFQSALDFCYNNNCELFLPDGSVYRLAQTITLRPYVSSRTYTIRANEGKAINIYADLPNNAALFIGSDYSNNNWTTICGFFRNVNFRVYESNNSNLGNVFTLFRALIFTNESMFDSCMMLNFGIIFEGTIKVLSTMKNCTIMGIKEAFMSGFYKVGGVFNEANFTGILNDSKILNTYLSGSAYYYPNCFITNNFDNDAQIRGGFFENFRMVFGYRYLNGVENTRTLVGCDIIDCIIQQSCRIVPLNAERFVFTNCWFWNFNRERILSVGANCPEITTLTSSKIGLFIAEEAEITQLKINLHGCKVGYCDYYIYVKSQPGSPSRAKLSTSIVEKNTVYHTQTFVDAAIVFEPAVVSVGTYGTSFTTSYFDTLQNLSFSTLPETESAPTIGNSYLKTLFKGQMIHVNGDIYIATSVDNRPVYKKIS